MFDFAPLADTVFSFYASIPGTPGNATFPNSATGIATEGLRMAYVDGASITGAGATNARYQVLQPVGAAGPVTSSAPSNLSVAKMAQGIPLAPGEAIKVYNDDGAARDFRVILVRAR